MALKLVPVTQQSPHSPHTRQRWLGVGGTTLALPLALLPLHREGPSCAAVLPQQTLDLREERGPGQACLPPPHTHSLPKSLCVLGEQGQQLGPTEVP